MRRHFSGCGTVQHARKEDQLLRCHAWAELHRNTLSLIYSGLFGPWRRKLYSKSPVPRPRSVYIHAQSSNNLIPRLTNHVSAQFLQGQTVLVHLYCAPLAPGLKKVPWKLNGTFKGGIHLSVYLCHTQHNMINCRVPRRDQPKLQGVKKLLVTMANHSIWPIGQLHSTSKGN